MNNLRLPMLSLMCSLSVLTMQIRLNPGFTGEIIDAIGFTVKGFVNNRESEQNNSIGTNRFYLITESGKKLIVYSDDKKIKKDSNLLVYVPEYRGYIECKGKDLDNTIETTYKNK